VKTLQRARHIAAHCGLHHVYTGNIRDVEGGTTYCAACNAPLIVRNWFEIEAWHLTPDGRCPRCGSRCVGVFDGPPGTWGARYEPVSISATGGAA
jgi:pyruvate formate lyase activating enzyme